MHGPFIIFVKKGWDMPKQIKRILSLLRQLFFHQTVPLYATASLPPQYFLQSVWLESTEQKMPPPEHEIFL